LFFEQAIEDLRQAADLFLQIHDRTDGVDGWVSLEVSPLLARNTAVVTVRDDRVLPDPQLRSTKWAVLHNFGGLRRSPWVCKSLGNLKAERCHGRVAGWNTSCSTQNGSDSGMCPFLCPRSFKISRNPGGMDSSPQFSPRA
jgi:hypothetical protein